MRNHLSISIFTSLSWAMVWLERRGFGMARHFRATLSSMCVIDAIAPFISLKLIARQHRALCLAMRRA
jgi:hypothetical protein